MPPDPSAPPRPARPAALPRAIWALGFTSLLMDVSSEMIHALLPVFLVTGLGASGLVVGLIDGAAEALALLVKVFSGALSDAWGRRKPLAVAGYGLGALSKPLFALAAAPALMATGSTALVLGARLMDRLGKGIRGAPRDALVADLAPPAQRGAAFGLRQSLDTVGAFLGPLLAIALMLLWADNFQAVFAVAVVPAVLSVAVLVWAVKEPERAAQPGGRGSAAQGIFSRERLAGLPAAYWWVVVLGAVFTLARFSEAFLILRLQQGGLGLAWAPLVLVAMNIVYALGAYPLGKLADRVSHGQLLLAGLGLLVAADVALAYTGQGLVAWAGIVLWGAHLATTQGLLSAMVAETAPAALRGTAFGLYNLASGGALLLASATAGWMWDRHGPASSFVVGAALACGAALVLLLRRAATARR